MCTCFVLSSVFTDNFAASYLHTKKLRAHYLNSTSYKILWTFTFLGLGFFKVESLNIQRLFGGKSDSREETAFITLIGLTFFQCVQLCLRFPEAQHWRGHFDLTDQQEKQKSINILKSSPSPKTQDKVFTLFNFI